MATVMYTDDWEKCPGCGTPTPNRIEQMRCPKCGVDIIHVSSEPQKVEAPVRSIFHRGR